MAGDSAPLQEGTERRRSARRRRWMRRNARRVPTAQRVRTFFRFCRWMFRWGGWLVGVPVLFLTARWVWGEFVNDASFGLRKVEFLQHHDTNAQELMKAAGLRYGDNLLRLDLSKIAARMKLHPQIKDVRLRRVMPHTLVMDLTTHRPAALLKLRQWYLMSASGVPYRIATPKMASRHLLRIRGIRKGEYVKHPKAFQAIFRHALALREVYSQKGLSRYARLREIRVDRVIGYVVKVGRTTIHLGHDQLLERLKALEKLFRIFGRKGLRKIQIIRLDQERWEQGKRSIRTVVKLYDGRNS